MICPSCEYEYVDGINKCPDCGTELIKKEEFDGNLSNPHDWVIVYTCQENYVAEMLKANLLGADIESIILTQKDSSYPVTSGNLAVVKLLVKKKDAEEALEIINDISKEEEI